MMRLSMTSGLLNVLLCSWLFSLSASAQESQTPLWSEKREQWFKQLSSNPVRGSDLTGLLDSWLTVDGFDQLRKALPVKIEGTNAVASQLRAAALIYAELEDNDSTLKLYERLTLMPDASFEDWYERAKLEARREHPGVALESLLKAEELGAPEELRKALWLHSSLIRSSENSHHGLPDVAKRWPDDQELQLEVVRWLARRSEISDQALSKGVADSKDPKIAQRWRSILAEYLARVQEWTRLISVAIEGIQNSVKDSAEERQFVHSLTMGLTAVSESAESAVSPIRVAEQFPDRREVALAVSDILWRRGHDESAIALLKRWQAIAPNDVVLTWMLQRIESLSGRVPTTDLSGIIRIQPPGALNPENERQDADQSSDGVGGLSPKHDLNALLAQRKLAPDDLRLAGEVWKAFQQAGRSAEAWHVLMAQHERLKTQAEQLKWWSLAASERQVTDRHFWLARRWSDQKDALGDTANFWAILAELAGSERSLGESADVLEKAVQLDEADSVTRLKLVRRLAAMNRFTEARFAAMPLLNTEKANDALLLLARVDLLEGKIDLAYKTITLLSNDEGLDESTAKEIASHFITWGDLPKAFAFLQGQLKRFPRSGKLTEMLGLAQSEAGDTDQAIETFFKLATLGMEWEQTSQPRDVTSEFGLVQAGFTSIETPSRLRAKMHVRRQSGLREGESAGDLRFGPGIRSLACAHLVQLSSNLPAQRRAALAKKAFDLHLPLPEWIELGQMSDREGVLALGLNEAVVIQRLNEPRIAEVWVALQGSPYRLEGKDSERAVQAGQAYETLVGVRPESAFLAALLWAQMDPGPAARRALVTSFAKAGDKKLELLPQLASALFKAPFETRKEFHEDATLLDALEACRVLLEGGPPHVKDACVLPWWSCYFWSGNWHQMAVALQDFSHLFAPKLPGAASERFVYNEAGGLKEWMLLRPTMWQWKSFPEEWAWITNAFSNVAQKGVESPKLGESDRQAFLMEADQLKEPWAKIAWLLVGGDLKSAGAAMEIWIQAQSQDDSERALAAAYSVHQGDWQRALDLLFALIPEQGVGRRAAQIRYLSVGLFKSGWSERQASPIAPPETHRARFAAIIEEILPELPVRSANGTVLRQVWLPVLNVLGLQHLAKEYFFEQDIHRVELWTSESDLRSRDYYESPRHGEWHLNLEGMASLLESGQRDRASTLILRQVRLESDSVFFGARNDAVLFGERLRNLVADFTLAKDLLAKADLEKSRTVQELLQAYNVAQTASEWSLAVAYLDKVLQLQGATVTVDAERELALLRTERPVSQWIEELQRHTVGDVQDRLSLIFRSVGFLRDKNYQIKFAGAMLELAQRRPEAFDESVHGGSRLLNDLILFLESLGPSAEPLWARLEELILKRPSWMRQSIRGLTKRYVHEGKPSQSDLAAYLIASWKAARGGRSIDVQSWLRVPDDRQTPISQFRLARLALAVLPKIGDDEALVGGGAESLAALIGSEIPSPKHPPLWALWECPESVTAGKYVHTKDQLAWNEERKALMATFTDWVRKSPAVWPKVFPYWAGYQLHYEAAYQEVLREARALKVVPTDPYGLLSFIPVACASYDNRHHIVAAELVETLLEESKLDLKSPAMQQALGTLMQLLQKGRSNQSDPMPFLALSPEEAEKSSTPLSAALQTRRRVVHDQLLARLRANTVLTVDLLFGQLMADLLKKEPTAEVEKKILAHLPAEADKIADALKDMIIQAQGRWKLTGESGGYEGGVWVGEQRLSWFETVLRIGRSLIPKEKKGDSVDPWLSEWIKALRQGNRAASPEVPPVSGNEYAYDYPEGFTLAAAATQPWLKRREALFDQGLELAIQWPGGGFGLFVDYVKHQMRQDPARSEAVLKVAAQLVKEDPKKLAGPLESWVQEQLQSPVTMGRASARTLFEKLIELWPAEAQADSAAWAKQGKYLFLGSSNDPEQSEPSIPLIPGLRRGWYAGRLDISVSLPGSRERLESWKRIVSVGVHKPSLMRAFFADFAALEIMGDRKAIGTFALQYIKEDVEDFGLMMIDLFHEGEADAPMERRVAWAKLVLDLLPLIPDEAKPNGSDSSNWLARTLLYLQEQPRESRTDNISVRPSPALVKQRDELIAAIRQVLQKDPGLEIETLVLQARQLYEQGWSGKPILELAQKALKSEPERLNTQLRNWCKQLLEANASAGENRWSAEILVKIAESWPKDKSVGPDWIREAMGVLMASASESNADPQGQDLIRNSAEKLTEVALGFRYMPADVLVRYLEVTRSSPDSLMWLQTRMLGRVRSNPTEAAELLKNLFSILQSNDEAKRVTSMSQWMQLGLVCVENWPRRTSPDTLGWVEAMLRAAAPHLPSELQLRLGRDQQVPQAVRAPEDETERRLAEKTVQSLFRAGWSPGWLPGVSIRLACQRNSSLAERSAFLQPWANADSKAAALVYVNTALTGKLVIEGSQEVFSLEPGAVEPEHPIAAEILDLGRWAQAAVSEKWISKESAPEVLRQIQARLEEVVKLGRKEPKVRSRFPRSLYRVLPSQADEAADLIGELAALTSAANTKPTAIELPGRLNHGLRTQRPAAELTDLVWTIFSEEPGAAANALEGWAKDFKQKHTLSAVILAGEVSLQLARKWTPAQPPPDWLVNFVSVWTPGCWIGNEASQRPESPQEARFLESQRRIRPQLIRILREFPQCQSDRYFPVVYAIISERDALTPEQWAALALVHLRSRKPAGPSEESVSLLPRIIPPIALNSELRSMFDELDECSAALFLLEYASRSKQAAWFDEQCRPAVLATLTSDRSKLRFDLLRDVYFASSESFVSAARRCVDSQKMHPPTDRPLGLWILRIANERSHKLQLEDWLQICDFSRETRPESLDGSSSPVIAWLKYSQRQGVGAIKIDLHCMLTAGLRGKLNSQNAQAALSSAYQNWVKADAEMPEGMTLFDDRDWAWAWRTLEAASAEPESFFAALQVAEELGLLAQRGLGDRLMLHAERREAMQTNTGIDHWKEWIAKSEILSEQGTPNPLWIIQYGRSFPIWAFVKLTGITKGEEAVAWLTANQSSHPTLGGALLLLGVKDRLQNNGLTGEDIQMAFRPCSKILEKQTEETRYQIGATIRALQPNLTEIAARAPVNALLQLLAKTRPSKQSVAKEDLWLQSTFQTVPVGERFETLFAPFADDLIEMIGAGSERVDEVLDHVLEGLTRRPSEIPAPSGLTKEEWIREQVGFELVRHCAQMNTANVAVQSGQASPVIDTLQAEHLVVLQRQVFAFLLKKYRLFPITFSSPKFSILGCTVLRNSYLASGEDGRALAHQMADWISGDAEEEAILFLPCFRYLSSILPLASIEGMSLEAELLAKGRPELEGVSALCRSVLLEERRKRSGNQVDDADPREEDPLLGFGRKLWKQKSLAQVVRIILAENLPLSVRDEHSGVCVKDWRARFALNQFPGLYFRPSPPLVVPEGWRSNPETRSSIVAATREFIYWIESENTRIYRVSLGSPSALFSKAMEPWLLRLEEMGESDLRTELLEKAAGRSLLNLDILLGELHRDFKTASEKIIPAYFQAVSEGKFAWIYQGEFLPKLKPQDVVLLEKLQQTGEDTLARRTALFILLSCPDAEEDPPARNATARVRDFIQTLDSGNVENRVLVESMLCISGQCQKWAFEIRPLFNEHPWVKEWRKDHKGDWSSLMKGSTRIELLATSLLTDALVSGNWKEWEVFLETARAEIGNQKSGPGSSPLPKSASLHESTRQRGIVSGLKQAIERAVCAVGASWLLGEPPNKWPRFAPALSAFVGKGIDGSADSFAREFCMLVSYLGDGNSVAELAGKLKGLPASVSWTELSSEVWRKVGKLELSAVERWNIASNRLRPSTASSSYSSYSAISWAVKFELLSPEDVRSLAASADLSLFETCFQKFADALWLSGGKAEVESLLRRIVSLPPAQRGRFSMQALARVASDAENAELVRAIQQAAESAPLPEATLSPGMKDRMKALLERGR